MNETTENLILECSSFKDIKENFLPKFLNSNLHEVMMMILDPLNSKLPEVFSKGSLKNHMLLISSAQVA